jgi:hypothetical protein
MADKADRIETHFYCTNNHQWSVLHSADDQLDGRPLCIIRDCPQLASQQKTNDGGDETADRVDRSDYEE